MQDTSQPPTIYIGNDPFFGRTEEQKRFRRLLHELQAPADPHEPAGLPYVMLVSGDGGIGKTTLLRRFAQIAAEEFADQVQVFPFDWEDRRMQTAGLRDNDRHGIDAETVFQAFYQTAIAHADWGHAPFVDYERLKQRREAVEMRLAHLQSGDTQRGSSSPLSGLPLRDLALFLRDEADTPRLCRLLGVAPDDRTKLQALRGMAENHLRANLAPEEFALFYDPAGELAHALAAGLRRRAAPQPLVILMDTYELVDRADPLMRTLIRASGPQVLWVIAGRNDLRRSRQDERGYVPGYEGDFPARLIAYDMGELAREDIRRYFAAQSPAIALDDAELDALAQATRGIPLAVRQAAQIYRQQGGLEAVVADLPRGIPHYQIIEEMTRRYTRYCLQHAPDREALYMLALANGSERVLRAMKLEAGTGLDFSAYMRRLERDYASVYRHTGRGTQQSYQLHETPAMFFCEDLRALRGESWVQTRIERAVTVLRQELARQEQLEPLIEERCDDDEDHGWVATTLELARFLLWQDEEAALTWIIPRFVEGLAYNRQLCDGLVQALEEERALLGKRGKTWLKVMESAGSAYFVPETEAALHEAVRRPRHQRYLAGAGEAERWAIVALRQGRLCANRKQYTQAQQFYSEAERGLPEEGEQLRAQLGERWLDLGISLKEQSLPEEALVAYKKAMQLQGDNFTAHIGLGNVYDDLTYYTEALQAYEQARHNNPESAHPWHGLGNIYRQQGDYPQAVATCQRALELDPTYWRGYNIIGIVHAAQGAWEAALTAYQQALEHCTSDQDRAVVTTNIGNMYHWQGDYPQALATYQRALELDPTYWRGHNGIGVVYEYQGAWEAALTAYQQALEHCTSARDRAVVTRNIGDVYRKQGNNAQALQTYQCALELDPRDAWTHNCIGLIYAAQQAWEPARAAFLQAVTLDPNDGSHHVSLANACYHLGDREAGDHHLALARPLMEQKDEYNRACFEAIAGNHRAALDLLRVALEKKLQSQEWARHDPDFAALRDDAEFRALVGLDPPATAPGAE
jgi:tetratricopeptide (TPR) repeat protein